MRTFKTLKDNKYFVIFMCVMTVYYIWRLFAIAPWYDELYTYRYFIDQGVAYSMTHWPLPNNHVLFSVCSAVLNKFMSPYMALRGVSLLASMGSFILLYRCMARAMNKTVAMAGCGIFASMYNVTQQAVQGRGYALSAFFLLAALTQLLSICAASEEECREKGKKRKYVLFALCLAGGLYTVPSNLYWVVPTCLAGGLFLLYAKDYRKLRHLVLASVCAAVLTVGLYGIIWGYTGASILQGDTANGMSEMNIGKIILDSPFRCMKLGLHDMLSNGVIQSISRDEFWNGLSAYLLGLLNNFYQNKALVVEWLILFCMEVLIIKVLRHMKERSPSIVFLAIYCMVMIIAIPLGICVQSVLPFVRIYTYLGSVLALLFVLAYYVAVSKHWDKIFAAMAIALAVVYCSSANYNSSYSGWDTEIKEALDMMDTERVETTLINDSYISHNIYFHINKVRNKNLDISYDKPDYMLVSNTLGNREDGITERRWYDYRTTEELPWEWMQEHMEKVYEGSYYTAYQVKK